MHRFISALALAALLVLGNLSPALASGSSKLFITSAVENPDDTVTLPLYQGTSNGTPVYYILLDSSDGKLAKQYGINRSNKLRNAVNTGAVQRVTVSRGVIDFPGTVDFTPNRVVVPSATGFPPLRAEPGAIGDAGYSPLIQLPGGAILNAPQVGNATGWADKVVSVDLAAMRVTFQETHGFQGGKDVKYVSTDASAPDVAALEGVTWAPKLAVDAPFGDDSTASTLASLGAFVNGQTGAANRQRQGLNSALLDGLDPLNVLSWNPSQGRYSPLWDVHPAAWTAAAITAGENIRQMDWGNLTNLADHGLVTGPGGAPFGAAGLIVNCPIVSMS